MEYGSTPFVGRPSFQMAATSLKVHQGHDQKICSRLYEGAISVILKSFHECDP